MSMSKTININKIGEVNTHKSMLREPRQERELGRLSLRNGEVDNPKEKVSLLERLKNAITWPPETEEDSTAEKVAVSGPGALLVGLGTYIVVEGIPYILRGDIAAGAAAIALGGGFIIAGYALLKDIWKW